MRSIYRGWYITKLGTRLEKAAEQQYRAVKGPEIIIGSYEAIKLEIDARELEKARKENEKEKADR